MKLKLVAAAAALVLGGVSVNASATIITATAPAFGTSFTDFVIGTITLGSTSNLSGLVFAADEIGFPGPFNFTLTLDAVTFTSATVGALVDADASAAGFSFSNVAAGSYIVKASGLLDGSGQLSKLAVLGVDYTATPVPEPETYALMLAGLCAVGFMVRRRTLQA
jgi:PEP-CTERM motif